MSEPNKPPFQTHGDYLDYVEMMARNGLEMGESPRNVAEQSIVSLTNVGDEKVLRLSGEPYVDEPVQQTRLYPKDVIHGSMRDTQASMPNDLRAFAVEILKRDLYDAMMAEENGLVETPSDSVAIADSVTPEEAEERAKRHQHADYDAPL